MNKEKVNVSSNKVVVVFQRPSKSNTLVFKAGSKLSIKVALL